MLRKKRDKPFFETMYMNYIVSNRFNRDLIKNMEQMIWVPITWKIKRKLKSVIHYVINANTHKDKDEAWICLWQFMDKCEKKADELWLNILHKFDLSF